MMTRVAGALLAVDLAAAAAHFRAGAGGLGALPLGVENGAHHGVHGAYMHLDAENIVGEGNLAHCGALHIKNFYVRHCRVLLNP